MLRCTGYLWRMRELDAISSTHFPATKQELIEAAADADLGQGVIERLQALSREQYPDAAAVERELAEEARKGTAGQAA